MNLSALIVIFLKGFAMGAADVVPGVSGGTIAFISGIYERLINAIRSFNIQNIRILFSEGFRVFFFKTDLLFLLVLFGGILSSILLLASQIEWVLNAYPQLLWSFFMGLILASIWYIARQVDRWSLGAVLMTLGGILMALFIIQIAPTQVSESYWMIFLSGFIAISAMMLPGISGSFLLVIMGMYPRVIKAINDLEISFLGVFILGCLLGLVLFSNILSWAFKHYRTITLATLVGFMMGALPKVWPWQNIVETYVDRHGDIKVLSTVYVWPDNYQGASLFWTCLCLFLLGIFLVWGLEYLGNRIREQSK